VLGQYAGIAVLYAASVALALLALTIPVEWLGWLGVLPILIGLKLLLLREDREAPAVRGASAVALVTVANGADNLAVYVPLFAASGPDALAAYGATFAVMTGLWCLVARRLVGHPAAQLPLRRWGPRLVPWLLVALGAWIVASAL